eukprot:scaffold14283_cov35-Cyclotella_meneghiniana.AAC.1
MGEPELCVRKSSVVVTGVTAYLPTGSKRIQQWSVVNMWPPLRILMRTRYSVKVPPINNDVDHIFPTACIPMVGKVAVAMLERNLMRLFIISIAPTANMKIDKRLHIRRINLLLEYLASNDKSSALAEAIATGLTASRTTDHFNTC